MFVFCFFVFCAASIMRSNRESGWERNICFHLLIYLIISRLLLCYSIYLNLSWTTFWFMLTEVCCDQVRFGRWQGQAEGSENRLCTYRYKNVVLFSIVPSSILYVNLLFIYPAKMNVEGTMGYSQIFVGAYVLDACFSYFEFKIL